MPNKKNNWFTQATMRAAMADAPAVMQASGWDYDKDNNLYQGDPSAEGATRLRENLKEIALMSGLDAMGAELAMPYMIKGVGKILRGTHNLSNLAKSRKVMRKLNKLSEALDTDNVFYNNPGKNDIQELYYFTGDTDRVVRTKRAGRNGKVVYADRTRFKSRYPSVQEADEALDEAIRYSSLERTNKTTKDILNQIAEDAASLNSGDKVSLITDEALSKDSFPLMQQLFLKNATRGNGAVRPVMDGNTYRMIRLNEYGRNPKSLQRIDRGLEQMRTLLNDPEIPDRISFGPRHTYVPAFEYTKFNFGGLLKKYKPEDIRKALNKLHQKM